MEIKCYICGDFIKEEEFCKTCLNFLETKYPNEIELEQILQWHKTHTKELNKD